MNTTTLNSRNMDSALEPYDMPLDMRQEVKYALESGVETIVLYARRQGQNAEATSFIYFPAAGRGGVCTGGDTEWTDCDGLDDLADRWENYDERWSN